MKVFEPLVADAYELVNAASYEDDQSLLFDEERHPGAWKPIAVERVQYDHRGCSLKPSDFPWLGSHALVMGRKANTALVDVLGAHGQVLPLITKGGVDLYVFNARRVNALDEQHSSIEKFPNGRIMFISKVAFVARAIEGLDVFRLSSYKASPTYLSERFIERYTSAGLCGLDFSLAWSS